MEGESLSDGIKCPRLAQFVNLFLQGVIGVTMFAFGIHLIVLRRNYVGQPLALIGCSVFIFLSIICALLLTKRVAMYFLSFTGNEACGYIGTSLITGLISGIIILFTTVILFVFTLQTSSDYFHPTFDLCCNTNSTTTDDKCNFVHESYKCESLEFFKEVSEDYINEYFNIALILSVIYIVYPFTIKDLVKEFIRSSSERISDETIKETEENENNRQNIIFVLLGIMSALFVAINIYYYILSSSYGYDIIQKKRSIIWIVISSILFLFSLSLKLIFKVTDKDNNLFFYISIISLTIAFSYLFTGVTIGNYSETYQQCCKTENIGSHCKAIGFDQDSCSSILTFYTDICNHLSVFTMYGCLICVLYFIFSLIGVSCLCKGGFGSKDTETLLENEITAVNPV